MKNKSTTRLSELDVGHPVVTANGACGIITERHLDGDVTVDLIGGSTVRVGITSLKDYFLTPFLVSPQVSRSETQKRTRTETLQEKVLLFLHSRDPVSIAALISFATAEGAGKDLANAVVYKLLAAKQICRSGVRGHYRYRKSFRDEKPAPVVKEQRYYG